MRKIYFSSILLYLSLLGFSQIPNFPTREQPNPSVVQKYSDQSFTNSQKNKSTPALSSSFRNSNASMIQQQNMMMVQNDFKRIEEEEKQKILMKFKNKKAKPIF